MKVRLPPIPRSAFSVWGPPGSERLLLLGARLLPRRIDQRLARDIETERLWLRSIGKWRTRLLVAPWHRDPELMGALMPQEVSPSRSAWLQWYAMPDGWRRFSYAIVPKGQRLPVGIISVHVEPDGTAESHIAISDPAWRGRQLSVEARNAILTLFFDSGVVSFIAGPDSRNLGSIFVYKKLGFRVIGAAHGEQIDPATGRLVDRVRFALTREEWKKRHGAAGNGGRSK